MSSRNTPQARQQALHEAQSLRASLKGRNRQLDDTLRLITDAATKALPSTGVRAALRGLRDLFGGGRRNVSEGPSLSDLADQTSTLIEQLAPTIFGGSVRTPEQAGGTQIPEPPAPRRIVPEEPETWQGMRLLPNDGVEIRGPGFRGRYRMTDPEITGEMLPVRSSNVHSIGFQLNLKNPARSQLIVKYLQGAKGQKVSGPTYAYKNVHPRLFRQFVAANSKGRFVWDELRIRGTIAGHQYEYVLTHISGGYLPRRAIIQNGIQMLKRRQRVSERTGRTLRSQKRDRVIGPYRPARNTRPNVGNPDRGRPNRGR